MVLCRYLVMQLRKEMLKYERIRDLRIDQGLTQTQIAEVLHIKQNTYSQYETGVISLTAEVLIKLSNYYGVSIDYLLDQTDNPKRLK